jgi:YggT family protein
MYGLGLVVSRIARRDEVPSIRTWIRPGAGRPIVAPACSGRTFPLRFAALPAVAIGRSFAQSSLDENPDETFAMRALLDVILLVLQIYVWLLIAAAILSWLIAFNVVNTRNQLVSTIGEFLYRITEPALRPIRNILPNLGGIDISPVILILIIFFIQSVIVRYIYPSVF